MSFIQDLIARAHDVLAVPKPVETRSIRTNSFDRADWETVRSTIPAIQQDMAELQENVSYVDDLMADLHAGFFKVDPHIRDASEMKPSHAANREVIDTIMQMPEVQNLRQHSRGDTYGSAMAMTSMKDVMVETLTTVKEAQAEAEQRAADAQAAADEHAKQMQALMDQMANDPQAANDPLMQGMLQSKMDQFNKAQQQGQAAQQQAQQAAGQAMQGMANNVRSQAKATTQELDEEQQLMSAYGVDPGQLQNMPVKERIELARKLQNNRLSKFAKLLGQFRMVQQAESRKRVINASSEVHGITQSNFLERMVASEYLNYADPALETLMLMRWAEHQLNTYDVRGKENLGQGPIICVVDESGSMGCEDVAGGSREAWSKALSLAMLDQARRRKRDFVYIGFSSAGQQHTVEFLNGESSLDKVIAMTEHFFGGGTNYEQPLRAALTYIEKHYDANAKARPDVLFMSDDAYGQMDPSFMSEWNRIKDKTSIKCYGIAIGCDSSGAMQQVSDNVREITEMVSDPRNVGDLFRTI